MISMKRVPDSSFASGMSSFVPVDLVADSFVDQHALDARHLLDLEPHRVGVLERDRRQVTELAAEG
jgi:hypothetical protein